MPITVNGLLAGLPVDPRVSLLDFLHEPLHQEGLQLGRLRRGVPIHVTQDLAVHTIVLSRDELRERQPLPLRGLQRHRRGHRRWCTRERMRNESLHVHARSMPRRRCSWAAGRGAKYLAGGTNLVDLLREAVERPQALVHVTGLSHEIRETDGGGLWIGAAATNTALAEHPAVRTR